MIDSSQPLHIYNDPSKHQKLESNHSESPIYNNHVHMKDIKDAYRCSGLDFPMISYHEDGRFPDPIPPEVFLYMQTRIRCTQIQDKAYAEYVEDTRKLPGSYLKAEILKADMLRYEASTKS